MKGEYLYLREMGLGDPTQGRSLDKMVGEAKVWGKSEASLAWAYIPKNLTHHFSPQTQFAPEKFCEHIRNIWHFYGFSPIKSNLYPEMGVLNGKSMKNYP